MSCISGGANRPHRCKVREWYSEDKHGSNRGVWFCVVGSRSGSPRGLCLAQIDVFASGDCPSLSAAGVGRRRPKVFIPGFGRIPSAPDRAPIAGESPGRPRVPQHSVSTIFRAVRFVGGRVRTSSRGRLRRQRRETAHGVLRSRLNISRKRGIRILRYRMGATGTPKCGVFHIGRRTRGGSVRLGLEEGREERVSHKGSETRRIFSHVDTSLRGSIAGEKGKAEDRNSTSYETLPNTRFFRRLFVRISPRSHDPDQPKSPPCLGVSV